MFLVSLGLFLLVGCQSPTRLVEKNFGIKNRLFSKVRVELDLKRSVVVDVRSRFQFEMSRLPGSFHAYWKDWSLAGFKGKDLVEKKNHLQRFLALNGIDPLTRVVILGQGLKGRGEEFLLAATLMSLGVKKLHFLNEEQARSAVTIGDGIPVENVSYWNEDIQFLFDCKNEEESSKPDIIVSSDFKNEKIQILRPSQIFSKNFESKIKLHPKKNHIKISSPDSFWAYGLAIYLKEQGYAPCVL